MSIELGSNGQIELVREVSVEEVRQILTCEVTAQKPTPFLLILRATVGRRQVRASNGDPVTQRGVPSITPWMREGGHGYVDYH